MVMAQVGQSGGMGGRVLENGSIAGMARSLNFWSGRERPVTGPVAVKALFSSYDRIPRI